jgi:hypothetical protein
MYYEKKIMNHNERDNMMQEDMKGKTLCGREFDASDEMIAQTTL